ncbi:MAG TPA: DUF4166 domain-containing protein [Rhizomicrobium sp.]|jgi:hypothetical protein|nr:DUF4166 domain-containing protein [Rhizomicrobium sp.]
MNTQVQRLGLHDPSIDVCSSHVGDLRFRGLLPAADWNALPHAVRRRFSERLAGGDSVVYAGEVTAMRRNWAGWVFCQMARLIGSPLPLYSDLGMPAVVTVTEDARSGGQIWTRMYARRGGFPQVVHSAKRFGGVTGLEEYVGRGVGMALTVHVADGALLFKSAGYFVTLMGRRVRLPRGLTPGALTVTHRDYGGGRFLFALDVVHPKFGHCIHQAALFKEASP